MSEAVVAEESVMAEEVAVNKGANQAEKAIESPTRLHP
jgi:hypothetical protein